MVEDTLLENNQVIYGILFDLFRRSSNETEVITEKLISSFGSNTFTSLLDIGAGDGTITQKLMPYFDEVYAVEFRPDNIYFLQSLGINVVKGKWEDISLSKSFDRILVSHFLYYIPTNQWKREVLRMIDLLEPKGNLYMILNSVSGEYTEMMTQFHQKVHSRELINHPSSRILVNILKEEAAKFTQETLRTKIVFENKHHFLSLCQFYFGLELNAFKKISSDLEKYYSGLRSIGKKDRKFIELDINLITITKS